MTDPLISLQKVATVGVRTTPHQWHRIPLTDRLHIGHAGKEHYAGQHWIVSTVSVSLLVVHLDYGQRRTV